VRHCHDARDVVLLETVLLLAEVSHQVAPRLVVLNKTVRVLINATVSQDVLKLHVSSWHRTGRSRVAVALSYTYGITYALYFSK
jgi:hypothetical protein